MTRSVARTAKAAVVALLTGLAATLTVTPAQASTIVTPGNFTGYGFDQCLAPTQGAMDAWLKNSPFLAVGIYISGDSRACRSQPNLTKTWVSTQLRNGWRLLPITLGPQASCSPRFPRYGNDETINPRPGADGKYGRARAQGRAEAVKAVAAAKALGIAPRSTLWYDIEGFDHTRTHCRESALRFLSGWTFKLHELGYVSGVYSSVGSGIKILDDARVNRPNAFHLPDMIWLARWDGNGQHQLVVHPQRRLAARRPGEAVPGRAQRDLGRRHDQHRPQLPRRRQGVVGAAREPLQRDQDLLPPLHTHRARQPADTAMVKALQCLLKEEGVYAGRVNGTYNERLRTALRSWQKSHGFAVRDTWTRPNWMSLLVAGQGKVLKWGSAGPEVRRLQRALNAAHDDAGLGVTGVFKKPTGAALRTYQRRVGVKANGIAGPSTWRALRNGKR